MHYCIAELGQFLRGLNKGQKKEIYFCNKAKIFSSFLLILMHVFIMQNSRSLKEAFDHFGNGVEQLHVFP